MADSTDVRRFSEPASISLSAVHPWGPWASRAGGRLRIAPLGCSLRSPGPEPLDLSACELEPLRNAADGSSVEGSLSLEPSDEDSWPLAPGEVGSLRLGGQGRLAPGSYSSRLVLTVGDGGPAASVPVTLIVRAHWLWAFGFMLLGLSFLGLLLLLAGRATLKDRLADALGEQQQLHELLESSPPTLADQPLARQAREDVAAAIETLTRPRPLGSIEDPRLARAERYLATARTAAATLRQRTGDKTPGRLAVDALETEWLELAERLTAAEKHLTPKASATAGNTDFASLLVAVQHRQWSQRLAPLPLAVEQGLGPHVDRAHLALATGEQERARKLAQHVTLWLRRAARQLDWESRMLLTWRSFAAAILSRAVYLEQARIDPALPESARRRLEDSLATARRLLEPASLEGFRDADRELQRAETELLQVRSDQLIEQLQVAIAAVDERTSLRRVEAALEAASPGEPKEVRIREVLNGWRETITEVNEAEVRQQLLDRVAAMEKLLGAGDLPAMIPGFGELQEAWTSYQQAQTEQAKAAVIGPYCQQRTSRLRSQHQQSLESLALLQPHPDLSDLEAELDRIGTALEAGFSGADCLERLTGRSAELLEVGDRLFSTYLLAADVTAEDRLANAEYSEVAEAVTLARRLMQEPRPLRLELRTPLDEIQVDRRVTFEVGDLGPSWGPGTSIRIDFGDGSAALLRNAEELHQEPLLHHRYTRPQRTEVRIVAVQETGNEVLEEGGEAVGEGRVAFTVGPSRITLARSLASFFLSVRFALALAVGLLIQGWRFYDEHPFGSRRRDYLEAFALGVGTQGLVEGLATALVQLASGG